MRHMMIADLRGCADVSNEVVLVSGLVKALTGSFKLTYHANGQEEEPIEIDFTPPFRSHPTPPLTAGLTNEIRMMNGWMDVGEMRE